MRRDLVLVSILVAAACSAPPSTPPAPQPGPALPPGHPPIGAAQAPATPSPHARASAPAPDLEEVRARYPRAEQAFEREEALGAALYKAGAWPESLARYDAALGHAAAALELLGKAHGKTRAGCAGELTLDALVRRARTEAPCVERLKEPVLGALARRGNLLYLLGRADEAVEAHTRALALEPRSAESLFYVGAILFDTQGDDVRALTRVKEVWSQYLTVVPKADARADVVRETMAEVEAALRAGGLSKVAAEDELPPGHPPIGARNAVDPAGSSFLGTALRDSTTTSPAGRAVIVDEVARTAK